MQIKHSQVRSVVEWLLAHNDRRTQLFTYICFSAAPIAGSLASVLVYVGSASGIVGACRGDVPLSRDRSMWCMALLIYIYAAAYVLSLLLNPGTNWHDLAPVLPLVTFPFLYSAWRISHKQTVRRAVLAASALGCYGALALAMWQFHLYGMRAQGGAGNAIVFATVMCLASSLSLAAVFIEQRHERIMLFFGAYCAGIIAILYSGSRMIWVAAAVASVTVIWIFRTRWLRHVSGSLVLVFFVSAAVIAVVGVQTIPGRIGELAADWHKITRQGDYDSSLGRRVILWRTALASIEANPIVGTGPQSTKPLIRQGFASKGMDVGYSHFHNGFLTAWIESGLVGMVALAGVFFIAVLLAIRTLRRAKDKEAMLGATMLVSTAVIYLTGGMAGILIGHDILDAMLLAFLAVGLYLADGTSELASPAAPFTSLATTAEDDASHAGGRHP